MKNMVMVGENILMSSHVDVEDEDAAIEMATQQLIDKMDQMKYEVMKKNRAFIILSQV